MNLFDVSFFIVGVCSLLVKDFMPLSEDRNDFVFIFGDTSEEFYCLSVSWFFPFCLGLKKLFEAGFKEALALV
jgi:hypothetical protein